MSDTLKDMSGTLAMTNKQEHDIIQDKYEQSLMWTCTLHRVLHDASHQYWMFESDHDHFLWVIQICIVQVNTFLVTQYLLYDTIDTIHS